MALSELNRFRKENKGIYMKTIFVKPENIERKWYLIDAEDKILGRVAAQAATILRGKNKALFTPNQEIGDYVVIINAGKIAISGQKAQDKLYRRHSGYVGGLKTTNYETLMEKKPTSPLELAIKGMLPKGPLGRKLLKNAKIYPGAEHPHAAQNLQTIDK